MTEVWGERERAGVRDGMARSLLEARAESAGRALDDAMIRMRQDVELAEMARLIQLKPTQEEIESMLPLPRALELIGQAHETFVDVPSLVASLDDEQIAAAALKAQHWISVAGERAAALIRRDRMESEAHRLDARTTTRGAGSTLDGMSADAPRGGDGNASSGRVR